MMTEKDAAKPLSGNRKIVVFRIGEEEFGVDISHVNRITKIEKITPIPNTPEFIAGVMNLRGTIVVIINLGLKLGFPPRPSDDDSRIIFVDVKGTPVGMIVDYSRELLNIEEKDIQKTPELISRKIKSDYIEGVAVFGSRVIILVNLKNVLEPEEIEDIKSTGLKGIENNITTQKTDS